MKAAHKTVIYPKAISWLLIGAVLMVTILPAHYHLHHLYNDDMHSVGTSISATTHAHVIDLHLLTDTTAQSHHEDEASIAASPDTMVKKINPVFSPIILLAIVLALLPILTRKIIIQPDIRNSGYKKHYPYFSPLLRAPPLH